MKTMLLKENWANAEEFACVVGSEAVAVYKSLKDEYAALRNSVLLSDLSYLKPFIYTESDAIDNLDAVLTSNILKLRYGKVVDSFFADNNGNIAAETFVADTGDFVLLIADALENADISALKNGAKDAGETHCLFSVDGPLAYKAAKEVFGSDILNLSFMSCETYDYEGEKVVLLRCGKTGEFGYMFFAPKAVAGKLFKQLKCAVESLKGTLGGFKALDLAAMESNFYCARNEGAKVGNMAQLGLLWAVDFDKESFSGSEKIFGYRKDESLMPVVCVKGNIADNAEIFADGESVGRVVCSKFSYALNDNLGMAVFKRKYALAGFEFSSKASENLGDISTISRPCVMTKSLENGMEQ